MSIRNGASEKQADRSTNMIQTGTINVYEALKSDIVMGNLSPGSKLKMEMLKSRYGMGVNVIMESLARLATEDLVDAENQKGFRVARTSISRLRDLVRLRILFETDGVKHSIEHGGIDWETSLVAAYHKLEYIEKKMQKDAKAHCINWYECDRDFHNTLISACGSKLHILYHRRVYEQYRQYVMVDLKANGFRGEAIIKEHKDILQAALDRDFNRCCRSIEVHLGNFLQQLSS
jgi:DNA-binding GntR family transcriptional regulator